MIALTYINLIFCLVAFFYGLWVYKKVDSIPALLLALAFGFFGITHIPALVAMDGLHPFIFIALRALGYLLGLGALVSLAGKKR